MENLELPGTDESRDASSGARTCLWFAAVFGMTAALHTKPMVLLLGIFLSILAARQKPSAPWILQSGVVLSIVLLVLSGGVLVRGAPETVHAWAALGLPPLLLAIAIGRKSSRIPLIVGPVLCLLGYGFVIGDTAQTALLSILATACIFAGLSQSQEGSRKTKTRWHTARLIRLVVVSAPWVATLFFLFPRVAFNQAASDDAPSIGSTGLSDSMAPGSISELVRSGKPAFTAQFTSRVPDASQLYWRAAVFDSYDGSRWTAKAPAKLSPESRRVSQEEIDSKPFTYGRYRIKLAPQLGRFLPVPDGNVDRIGVSIRGANEMTLRPNQAGVFQSPAKDSYGTVISGVVTFNPRNVEPARSTDPQAHDTAVPAGLNPLTRDLASRAAIDANGDVGKIVESFSKMIGTGDFWYSLKPPIWGRDGVDQFLFESRRGFCEHYATAFVTFMRHAGVPARVVTGYHGGAVDASTGSVTVASKDAHAWAEILEPDGRWERIDPTSFVAPERVEPEIENSSGAFSVFGTWGEQLQALSARLEVAWKEHVLDYDGDLQDRILAAIGVDPRHQSLFTFGCLILLALGSWAGVTFWQRVKPSYAPCATEREFRRLSGALSRFGVSPQPHQTAACLIAEVRGHMQSSTKAAAAGPALIARLQRYSATRYGV